MEIAKADHEAQAGLDEKSGKPALQNFIQLQGCRSLQGVYMKNAYIQTHIHLLAIYSCLTSKGSHSDVSCNAHAQGCMQSHV